MGPRTAPNTRKGGIGEFWGGVSAAAGISKGLEGWSFGLDSGGGSKLRRPVFDHAGDALDLSFVHGGTVGTPAVLASLA